MVRDCFYFPPWAGFLRVPFSGQKDGYGLEVSRNQDKEDPVDLVECRPATELECDGKDSKREHSKLFYSIDPGLSHIFT
jgi:hypothetical protein